MGLGARMGTAGGGSCASHVSTPSRRGPWLCRVFKEDTRGQWTPHVALAPPGWRRIPLCLSPSNGAQSFPRDRVADGKHAKTLTYLCFGLLMRLLKFLQLVLIELFFCVILRLMER